MIKIIKAIVISSALAISVMFSHSYIYAVDDTLTPSEESSSSSPTQEEIEQEFVEEKNFSEYSTDVKEVEIPVQTPASVTGEVYQGSGTVVDFSTTASKAFYTVEGNDNKLFYIIIDLDKTSNNVYFLSPINGEELSLSNVSSSSGYATDNSSNNISNESTNNNNKATTNSNNSNTNTARNSSGGGNSFLLIVIVVAALIVLVFGYQTKVKKNNPDMTVSKLVGKMLGNNKGEEPSNIIAEDDDIYDDEDDYLYDEDDELYDDEEGIYDDEDELYDEVISDDAGADSKDAEVKQEVSKLSKG